MFTGTSITAIVRTALNRALELDPAGRKVLLECLAEPVSVSLTTPVAITLTLSNDGNYVQVDNQTAEEACTVIRGGPVALAALALGDSQVLADGRLVVEGNTEKARQLSQALSQLKPDWEAAMAGHLGDVPAHFLGQRIRNAVLRSQQAMASITASLEEYIHEESQSLPGRREMAARFRAIDDLSQRTSQLEARLNKLDNTGSDNQTEKL
ncbi:MAG: ubiquinone biosynthesis accessory factor UbiJ [Marinobacter sp.]